MNWLAPTLLFGVTWIALFAQTQFDVFRALFGFPLSILPALVVYTALTLDLWITSIFCCVSGLLFDSLSEARLGVSVAPLFAVGFALHFRRHLILREQTFARFWLGFGAGFVIPLATLGVTLLGNRQPSVGWPAIWQALFIGLFNGLACPICFRVFDWLKDYFDYQPIPMSSFRADREIKRGRN